MADLRDSREHGDSGMVGRVFDICCSAVALVLLAPVLITAAVGIRLCSSGPALYRAQRVGQGGRPFVMYKMRTMHCRSAAGSSITAADDPRVFALGRLLRAFKIDELPQLLNVLRGEMSIVGPRPEAVDIVQKHYTPEYLASLDVRPGLTSPGSICYYTHGEQLLADGDAEQYYVSRLLPIKMAIDLAYLRRATFLSDLAVIFRTAAVLALKAAGRKRFPDPPEFTQFLHTHGNVSSANDAADRSSISSWQCSPDSAGQPCASR